MTSSLHRNLTLSLEHMFEGNVTDYSQQQFGTRVTYATILIALSILGLAGNIAVSFTIIEFHSSDCFENVNLPS